MKIKSVHYFIIIAITATVSASLTYLFFAKPSDSEPCTKFAQNLSESQEPEVETKHRFCGIHKQ